MAEHWLFLDGMRAAWEGDKTLRIDDAALVHQLGRVWRVRVDETLTVMDAANTPQRPFGALATVHAIDRRHITLTLTQALTAPTWLTTQPTLVAVVALIKGQKWDWLIQKLTELGVHHIVPLQAMHSVVQVDATDIPQTIARWQAITTAAAQQSERWCLPQWHAPTSLAKLPEVLQAIVGDPSTGHRLVLEARTAEQSLHGYCHAQPPENSEKPWVIAVGPEGGWHPDELTHFGAQGFTSVLLMPNILRAETASIAVFSTLQAWHQAN